jgi:hypothetical protein
MGLEFVHSINTFSFSESSFFSSLGGRRIEELRELPFRQPHIASVFQPCSLPRFADLALAAPEIPATNFAVPSFLRTLRLKFFSMYFANVASAD